MSPTAVQAAPLSGLPFMRILRDEDPAELQRRLEAWLLIVSLAAPALSHAENKSGTAALPWAGGPLAKGV